MQVGTKYLNGQLRRITSRGDGTDREAILMRSHALHRTVRGSLRKERALASLSKKRSRKTGQDLETLTIDR